MSELHEIGRTRETDADIIRMFEDALEKAKRGEILNAGIVVRSTDNTYGMVRRYGTTGKPGSMPKWRNTAALMLWQRANATGAWRSWWQHEKEPDHHTAARQHQSQRADIARMGAAEGSAQGDVSCAWVQDHGEIDGKGVGMTKAERAPMLRRTTGDKEDLAMNLPEGKTCNDCVHCYRCTAMFGHIPADEVCDWYPSRFHAKGPTK